MCWNIWPDGMYHDLDCHIQKSKIKGHFFISISISNKFGNLIALRIWFQMFSDIFAGFIVETFSLIHPFDDVWMYSISSLNSFVKCKKQKKEKIQRDHHTKQLKDQKESLILWCRGSFALLRGFLMQHIFYICSRAFWKTEAGTYCINVDFTELYKWDWILNLQVWSRFMFQIQIQQHVLNIMHCNYCISLKYSWSFG